jgi:hypothetical protein
VAVRLHVRALTVVGFHVRKLTMVRLCVVGLTVVGFHVRETHCGGAYVGAHCGRLRGRGAKALQR